MEENPLILLVLTGSSLITESFIPAGGQDLGIKHGLAVQVFKCPQVVENIEQLLALIFGLLFFLILVDTTTMW